MSDDEIDENLEDLAQDEFDMEEYLKFREKDLKKGSQEEVDENDAVKRKSSKSVKK